MILRVIYKDVTEENRKYDFSPAPFDNKIGHVPLLKKVSQRLLNVKCKNIKIDISKHRNLLKFCTLQGKIILCNKNVKRRSLKKF